MKSFTLNGKKFINGYLCNDAGQPITMKTGYSSEDEKESHQRYLEALQMIEEDPKIVSQGKYTKKITVCQSPTMEELAEEKEWYESKQREKDGYLLNDADEKKFC